MWASMPHSPQSLYNLSSLKLISAGLLIQECFIHRLQQERNAKRFQSPQVSSYDLLNALLRRPHLVEAPWGTSYTDLDFLLSSTWQRTSWIMAILSLMSAFFHSWKQEEPRRWWHLHVTPVISSCSSLSDCNDSCPLSSRPCCKSCMSNKLILRVPVHHCNITFCYFKGEVVTVQVWCTDLWKSSLKNI